MTNRRSRFSLRLIFLIALTGNYNHLRLHCSLGKVLVSSRAISTLLVYWLGKSEAGHSCFHSSLLDCVFIWCPSDDAYAFNLLVWRQTRVKTDNFFLRNFTPRNDTEQHTEVSFISSLTHSPLLYSVLPSLSCVSKPFRLSLDHALTSHADGNVIQLTYALSLHLLLHLFLSPWLSRIVSQLSTKQTSFPLFFSIHTQHLGLDWDLDSSRRLSNPSCPL